MFPAVAEALGALSEEDVEALARRYKDPELYSPSSGNFSSSFCGSLSCLLIPFVVSTLPSSRTPRDWQ